MLPPTPGAHYKVPTLLPSLSAASEGGPRVCRPLSPMAQADCELIRAGTRFILLFPPTGQQRPELHTKGV